MTPGTVSVQFADGSTSTGLLLTADGDVLTAGHCCVGPNRQATIRLPDGRVADATTRGVDRSRNLGLLKISTPGPWPAIDMPAGGDLPRNLIYFGIGYSKGSTPGDPPLSFVADPKNHERHSREWQGVVRHFYVLPYGGYYIWGATAGMLMNFQAFLRA